MTLGPGDFVAWPDIDFEGATLRVTHGKGSKERTLPLRSDVAQALSELPYPHIGRLWPTATAQGLSRAGNDFLHNEVGTSSTMHTLRHRCLTDFYRASTDILATMNIAGHSNPAITAVYAAADVSKSGAIMESMRKSA